MTLPIECWHIAIGILAGVVAWLLLGKLGKRD
jgi:hypothetical protein